MDTPNELSFLPDDYLEKKAQRRTNVIFAGLFLLIVGGMTSAFVLGERAARQEAEKATEVERQYADVAKPLEQFRQMQDKQRQMMRQAEVASSLIEKVPRSTVLGEITKAVPAGLSLTDLALISRVRTTAAAQPTGTAYQQSKAEREKKGKPADASAEPKQYDVSIKMTGIAMNNHQVMAFFSTLGNMKWLFRSVDLLISEEHTVGEQKVRKFQLEAVLSPDADVKQDMATAATSTN